MLNELKIYRSVVFLASTIIIVMGLMAAKSIVVPLLLAAFIAIVISPLFFYFTSKGMGKSIALTLVLFFIILLFFLFSTIVSSSISAFNHDLPVYESQLSAIFQKAMVSMEGFGFSIPTENINEFINPTKVMQFTGKIFDHLSELLSNGMMILFLVIFMLLEATVIPKKINALHENFSIQAKKFSQQVKSYMVLKSIFSLITGLLVALMLWALGVHYALLWGTFAFLLNYIPNIGSMIAAIPAILLALIQMGSTTAMLVALGFVLINVVIGSIIEPKYMGDGLGLSVLVVFISLIFWGWVFGPIGMLLSVPLTVMFKIALESNNNTKWVAMLLDSKEP